MKPKSRNYFLGHILSLSSVFAVVISPTSHGATRYWDTTTTASVQPGAGIWGTDSFWTADGNSLGAWPGAANVAVFAGSGAVASSTVNTNAGSDASAESIAITLGANQTAQKAFFNNTGFVLQAASPLTLSLTDVGTGVVTIGSGKSASIGTDAKVAFTTVSNTGVRTALGSGGTLNIKSGATYTKTGGLAAGPAADAGTLGFSGTGTINVAGTLSYNPATPGAPGGVMVGSLASDNVTLNINSGGLVSSNSTGNGIIVSNNATATGTVNLNTGGTLSVNLVKDNNGSSTFNFNGGTLQARVANATFLAGLDLANVKAGGAVIDTNGVNVTIGQFLLHDSSLGATLDGGLNKTNSGTLTLTGGNTYTGPTSVTGGILTIGGSGAINASSGITINGGGLLQTSSTPSTPPITLTSGTLDGTGTVGAVTVAHDVLNTLSNGNGGTGTLTMGSLTFNGDATVSLNYNGTTAPLAVTGALATTPATGLVFISVTGAMADGIHNLITCGSFGGSISDFDIYVANLGPRQVATPQLNGSHIAVNISGSESVVWTGATDDFWQTATTGDDSAPNNWARENSHTATNFWFGDTVEFNDTYNLGAGDVAVTQTGVYLPADVSPVSTSFNNSVVNYTVSGAAIAGGTLNKTGTGTLTLTNANTYTGATAINGGSLQLGDGVTDGSIAGTSGVANNGTLAYNLLAAATAAYPISGSGNLAKSGAATLTLTGTNTSSGSTAISEGSITVSGNGGLGSSGLSVASGANLNIDKGITLGQTVTGSGTITSTSAAQVTLTGDFSGFSGTYNHSTASSSTALNSTTATSANAAYNITLGTASSQGILPNVVAGGTFQLGSLGGVATSLVRNAGAVTGITILEIGNLGTDTVFAGTVTEGGGTGILGLTKVGAGILTLSGPNTWNGTTDVIAGTLAFTTTTKALGSSAFTVADGATLSVKAAAAGTTLLNTGGLTLGSAGTPNLTFDFNSLTPTVPQVATGALTVNGTVGVNVLNAGALPTGSYKLIDYASLSGAGSFPVSPFAIGTRGTASIINNNVDGSIDLTVTNDSAKWTGLDNGDWVAGSTGSNKNWKLSIAGTSTDYIEGDSVLFDDSASGTKAISINTADVSPTSTTFDTADSTYSLTGTFGISGIGGLTKSGTGSVTIATPNTYTGATTINAGTLQLGNGTADGTLANTSGVTNNGTLAYNLVAAHTVSKPISGTGNLTKTGAGTLTLNGTNTFTGGVSVNGGILAVNQPGLNNNAVTLAAGATLQIANVSLSSGTYAGNVSSSGAAAFTHSSSFGDVTLTGNWSGFSGTVTNASAGGNRSLVFGAANATTANAAYVANASAGDLVAGVVAGATYNLGSIATTSTVRALRNGSAVTGATTFSVGALNTNTSWNGVIGGGGGTLALTKVGNGTLTLSNTNTYTGATSVNGGTLNVTGSLDVGSAVAVASGATLKGTGTVAGTVSSAGTIAPGASVGTLTTGAVTLTGTLAVEIDGAAGDKLLSTGPINLTGSTLTVNLLAGGFTVASYVIAEGTSITGSFASVPSGYAVNIITGGAGQQAVLTSTGVSGFTAWATANAPGQTMDQDHDGDGVPNGVEYFMGLSGSSFTANPVPSGGTVTWTKGGSYTGVYGTDYEVQSSTDLSIWTLVTEDSVAPFAPNTVAINAGSVIYTMPTGGKRFVRLVVRN